MAHILQVLTELDPSSTVVSVHGIGAYDLMSWNAMMRGLRHVVEGDRILRGHFTANLQHTSGKMTLVTSTRSLKAVNRATRLHWQPLPKSCARERNSSRILMICTSSANQTGSEKSMLCCSNIWSAQRIHLAAHWASWADALAMIQQRHSTIVDTIVGALKNNAESVSIRCLLDCVRKLAETGFEVPDWTVLAEGKVPGDQGEDDPCQPKIGWQETGSELSRGAFLQQHCVAQFG